MEKKRLCFYVIAVFMIVVPALSGCGNKHIDNQAMEEEFENAPEWVLTGHEKGSFSAVGSARIGKSGIQFAKTAAMAQARNELARQLSVRVHSLVNAVSRQTGLGEGRVADHMAGQVTRQVADETLNGSRQKNIWISPGSDLYVLVVMDKEAVKGSVRNRVISEFRDEDNNWTDFEENNGGVKLDREIDNLF